MKTVILSNLLLLAAGGALAADPLARYEHDSFDTGKGKLAIYFFGHASLMMTWGTIVVYVDPVTEHADYARLPKAGLVLVTHEHFDHLDAKAIAAVSKKDTRIVLNRSSRDQLGKGDALANGDSAEVHGIAIRAVPAYNTTPGRDKFHPHTGRDNGYVLTIGSQKVYIAGDTEDIPEMAELKNVDIAFLPMNQPYTMTPAQIVHCVEMIKPKVLYPYHYGDTDTNELVKLMRDVKGTELRIRKMK
ncbi:MAG TPA: MBL fold metallo-hydrolase [Candidatus Edwardsbacteria bacterium]|nr:MBL fold metallo-hydrolase [Candidatus Edwardsbacteria bacterium]